MSPELTRYGLLPIGIHNATWDDFSARFGWNGRRKHLLRELGALIASINTLDGRGFIDALFVGGSFVTDKDHPGDIECVIKLNGDIPLKMFQPMQAAVQAVHDNDVQAIDAYINIDGVQRDLTLFFQYMRAEDCKARHMKHLDKRAQKGIIQIMDAL